MERRSANDNPFKELQRRYEELRGDHKATLAQYRKDKETWAKFKRWWDDKKRRHETAKKVKRPRSSHREVATQTSDTEESKVISENVPSKLAALPSTSSASPSAQHAPSADVLNRKTILEERAKVRAELAMDPYKYRGKGRYAASVRDGRTINADFEVAAERNAGLQHQFAEVVRSKAQRRQMHAGDCACCRDYYELVGPAPARAGPVWKTPSPPSPPARRSDRDRALPNAPEPMLPASQEVQDEKGHFDYVQAHKDSTSRHRHHWAPAPTPPGYWNIGFPTTQEAAELNQQAQDIHKRKYKEVEKEARLQGRYKRRK